MSVAEQSFTTASDNVSDSQVCEYCKKSPEERSWKFSQHESAARTGCIRCSVLVQGLRLLVEKHHLFSVDWEESTNVCILYEHPSSEYWWVVECTKIPESPNESLHESPWESLAAQFYVEAHQEASSSTPWLETGYHLSTTNVPNACLQFAAEALNSCVHNHPHCSARGEATVPKRLIAVTSASEQQDTVRLVDSAASNIPQDTSYAALSYCWGEDAIVKGAMLSMTKANLSELTTDFPTSRLPAVFRDAIITTRFLGIKFLWIDALCIAQGDLGEWRIESSKMKDTYSHAYVTIVADSSSSCAQSFLAMPERSIIESVKIKAESGGMEQDFFARLTFCYNPNFSFNILRKSAVSGRGWAFQESLLSRRILEFKHACVTFSCLETSVWEVGASPRNRPTVGARRSWFRLLEQVSDTGPFRPPPTMWTDAVSDYSGRQLTVPQDRLPAIAGLASLLKEQGPANNTYLAGLWEASLVRDLAWRCNDIQTHDKRLAGPSWSWASLNAQVFFFPFEEDESILHAALVQCKYRYDSYGEFGNPAFAKAILEGPSFQMSLTQPEGRRGLDRNTNLTDVSNSFLWPGNSRHFWYSNWHQDYPLPASQKVVDLLLLFAAYHQDYIQATCLALRESNTQMRRVFGLGQKPRYTRVGLYNRIFHMKPYEGTTSPLPEYYRKHYQKWLSSLKTKRFIVV